MVPGNRVCSVEDGEIHHPSAENKDGGGSASASASLSSVEQEIEEMRRRLRELEELEIPAAAAGASHEDPVAAATIEEKAEVDARSIYVGNVDYACLPEEIQQHFQDCGTINRVTILTDNFGQPKGFAYVEFLELEAVQNALQLNETELCGRPLKVCQKRTNIPGMKQLRGRRPFCPFYPSYPTYGKVPRFRRPSGYQPYY